MQLFFIRHGESQNNQLWRKNQSDDGRVEDPDLTKVGGQQAQIVADYLGANQEEFAITHIYTSLMLRAVKTARPIAEKLDLPLIAWPEIHEGGGIYLKDQETGDRNGLPGNPRSFFEANYPELNLPDWITEDGWWNRPHEERPETSIRAQKVLLELKRCHTENQDRVALVSHGGFYNYILNAIMHKTQRDNYWFELNNACISHIDFREDHTVFTYLNYREHLPKELIT